MTRMLASATLSLLMVDKLKSAGGAEPDDLAAPQWPEFGKLVTTLMDSLQLSVPEVAKVMGVSPEMGRRYRIGTAMPRKNKMEKLATLLGVSAADLYAAGGDPARVPAIGGPLIVDDPEERALMEAYRAMGPTAQKVLRHRATELVEQFGKPSKKNPYGKGN